MMVHPFAGRWRTARYKLKLLAPLWVLMWFVAWVASSPWREVQLYEHRSLWVAVPLLWSVSLYMYWNGARELSLMRLIGRDELEPEIRPRLLVTVGTHRIVRHPLYLGHLCTMLGWCLAARTAACFGLLAFGVITGAVMIRFEERELHARFGMEWEEYCRRTPAILPALKI